MRRMWILLTLMSITWPSCVLEEAHNSRRDKRQSAIVAIVKRTGWNYRHPRFGRIDFPKRFPTKHIHHGPFYINHYFYCNGNGHADKPNKFTQLDLHIPDSHDSNKDHFVQPLATGIINVDNKFGLHGSHNFETKHNLDTEQIKFDEIDLPSNLEENIEVSTEHSLHASGPELGSEENFGITTENEELFSSHDFDGLDHDYHLVAPRVKLHNSNEQYAQYTSGESANIHHIARRPKFGNGHSLSKVQIPDIYNHPLEHDPAKASYDTPGAVDSYGNPVQPEVHVPPGKFLLGNNFPSKQGGSNIEDYFSAEINTANHFYGNGIGRNFKLGQHLKRENNGKGADVHNENLVGTSNNITELVKSMRNKNEHNVINLETINDQLNNTLTKHQNHKYEE